MKWCVLSVAIFELWDNGYAASTANEAARATAAKRSLGPCRHATVLETVMAAAQPTLDAARPRPGDA